MRWGDGLYENEYGLKHQGQWQRDKMHGFGKQVACACCWWILGYFNPCVTSVIFQVDKYGSQYEGQYFAGKKEGQGCLVYFNGDKYTGHFFNNKKEGQGRLEDAHGGVYEGQWLNNRREGQGTQTDRNGATYSGQWRDNKRAGQGSM